jgi:hypothetical protein
MPGSPTTPGRPGARAVAPVRLAFRQRNSVGTRDEPTFAARWLACAIPCRRFAGALAGIDARLGADVVRYSFIVVDLHHLLLAGLPAHSDLGQTRLPSNSPEVVSQAPKGGQLAPGQHGHGSAEARPSSRLLWGSPSLTIPLQFCRGQEGCSWSVQSAGLPRS